MLDLYSLELPSQSLTENGMHFGPNGYAAVASAIRSQLKLTNGGKSSQQEWVPFVELYALAKKFDRFCTVSQVAGDSGEVIVIRG